jgi:hypothetical protein
LLQGVAEKCCTDAIYLKDAFMHERADIAEAEGICSLGDVVI